MHAESNEAIPVTYPGLKWRVRAVSSAVVLAWWPQSPVWIGRAGVRR